MAMPSLNLLRDPWIPVRTCSGASLTIVPAEITSNLFSDPIVDIDWPRADFRIAQIEFLFGLLAVACPPDEHRPWRDWWQAPPSPDELGAAFAPFADCFSLDGAGARFLQEMGDLGEENVPVSGLLIEQPGANTVSKNTDLFVRRGHLGVLARSTAAIALHTMQAFAPSGGAGHRTSLRGGGPLTSLALPPAGTPQATLWHLLWLNVVAADGDFDPYRYGEPAGRLADVFPWLGPTRTSEKGRPSTSPSEAGEGGVHPLQCYFGMPRRIRLDFEANVEGLACDITGRVEPVIVRTYRTRPWGVNYEAMPHPLTPTYRIKPGTEPLPVHPQPGGVAYRHWLGFVQRTETRQPAACIESAKRRLHGEKHLRIGLYGYDMDNMKARGFLETEQPLFVTGDADRDGEGQRDLERLAERFVNGAAETAGLVASAVRSALGRDASGLDLLRETFFRHTEAAFFRALEDAVEAIEANANREDLLQVQADRWLTILKRHTEQAFDRDVPASLLDAAPSIEALKKMVDARRFLIVSLAGYGKSGAALFKALGLAAPKRKDAQDNKKQEEPA